MLTCCSTCAQRLSSTALHRVAARFVPAALPIACPSLQRQLPALSRTSLACFCPPQVGCQAGGAGAVGMKSVESSSTDSGSENSGTDMPAVEPETAPQLDEYGWPAPAPSAAPAELPTVPQTAASGAAAGAPAAFAAALLGALALALLL